MAFREGVEKVSLGKMAQLWVLYMNHVWLAFTLIQSEKGNDFVSSNCMFLMPNIIFSFGDQNQARYLTFLYVFLAKIEESHPGTRNLLDRGAIRVSQSFVSSDLCNI